MTDPNALLSALEDVEMIVAEVDAKAGEVTDPEYLWAMLERVRGLRGRDFLASLEDKLVGLLHSAIPGEYGDYRLNDNRRIYKTYTKEAERWDGERLVSVVAARIADDVQDVDPESGEVTTPPLGVVCERVAVRVAECLGGMAPSTKWRVTPLHYLGIDPKPYRTSERGRPKVELDRG